MKIKVGFGYDVHRLEEGYALWLGGIHVEHIMDPRHRRPHEMTRFAHLVEGKIIYR